MRLELLAQKAPTDRDNTHIVIQAGGPPKYQGVAKIYILESLNKNIISKNKNMRQAIKDT